MNDDQLRDRLSASNPISPSHPVDPATSDRARALMEDVMSSPSIEPRTVERRRRSLITAVAAALVVVVGVGGLLATRSPSTGSTPLVLTAEGGSAMASCLPFDVRILADMSPAFAGTVTELTDSVATLRVDRWFTGGNTGTVQIRYTPGFEALIGTPRLEAGQSYLITATNGVVNGCGYSGLMTTDLETAFEEAFGS